MRILIIIALIILFSGCQQKISDSYMCTDGKIVRSYAECPKPPSTTTYSPRTTITTITTTTAAQIELSPTIQLTDADIIDALNLGKEYKYNIQSILEMYSYPEYSIFTEYIIINTKYSNIAIQSAQYNARDEEMPQELINSINSQNRMMFTIFVLGDEENFTRRINTRIILKNKTIYPIKTTNFNNPRYSSHYPGNPKYESSISYDYIPYDLIKNSEILFIINKSGEIKEYPINMQNYK